MCTCCEEDLPPFALHNEVPKTTTSSTVRLIVKMVVLSEVQSNEVLSGGWGWGCEGDDDLLVVIVDVVVVGVALSPPSSSPAEDQDC